MYVYGSGGVGGGGVVSLIRELGVGITNTV